MDQYYYLWILTEQLDIPLDVVRWEIFKMMGLEMISEYVGHDSLSYYCEEDDLQNLKICLLYLSRMSKIPVIDIVNNDEADGSLWLLWECISNSPSVFKYLYSIVDPDYIDPLLRELFCTGSLYIIKYLYYNHFDQNIEAMINKEIIDHCCDREDVMDWLYRILSLESFKYILSLIRE